MEEDLVAYALSVARLLDSEADGESLNEQIQWKFAAIHTLFVYMLQQLDQALWG